MTVSVIIPVYNSERYLHECIDSVLVQNFTDYELLLVNDGSTDSSGEICDEYAAKDIRVRAYHKKNGGVSSARNLGIEKAQGQWITFIDSDDEIKQDYFGVFKNNIPDVDLIFNDIDTVASDGKINSLCFDGDDLSVREFLNNYFLFPHFPGPVAKFYRGYILKNSNLRFDETVHNGEDGFFNFQFLFKATVISFRGTGVYIYKKRDISLSKRTMPLEETVYLYHNMLTLLENNGMSDKLIGRNLGDIITRYFFSILKSELKFSRKIEMLTVVGSRFEHDISRHLQSSTFAKIVAMLLRKRLYRTLVIFFYLRSNFFA